MKLNISPIPVVEEMANGIIDKSDIECKFFYSARDLSSDKKNLMMFSDLLLEKQSTCESYYIRERHCNVDCFYLA